MTPKEQKLWRARLQILRLKRRPPVSKKKKHRRMREYYQMDDLYPERYKLKEKGIDIEKWQEEVLRDDP